MGCEVGLVALQLLLTLVDDMVEAERNRHDKNDVTKSSKNL